MNFFFSRFNYIPFFSIPYKRFHLLFFTLFISFKDKKEDFTKKLEFI